jgi:hypothetical protein
MLENALPIPATITAILWTGITRFFSVAAGITTLFATILGTQTGRFTKHSFTQVVAAALTTIIRTGKAVFTEALLTFSITAAVTAIIRTREAGFTSR